MVALPANPKLKKAISALSGAVALLLIMFVALAIYVYQNANRDTRVRSDAIVVLGEAAMGGTSCFGPRCQAGVTAHPHFNTCLESRVAHAVAFYKDHYAQKIVMSGGTDASDNVNEAATMKTMALSDGVPASAILLENQSTSTYQNLAFSQKVLANAGLHSAIIVTDPATNARAGLVAAKLNYSYSLSPDTNTTCSHPTDYLVREPAALIDYFFTGKI